MAEKSLRILRPKAVREKLGVGSTWLWENVKNGSLPKPIHIGIRAVGFLESEIDEWIDERIAASRGGDHVAA